MTPLEFERHLDKYAEVVVKVGLNLQPGQRLLIGAPAFYGLAPVEAAPLIRRIAAHAYRAGARLVDVLWGDDQLRLIRLQHARREWLDEFPAWQVATTVEHAGRGDALLLCLAHDPELLQGQDGERLTAVEEAAARNTAPVFDYLARSVCNWSAITPPVPGWSDKVFPDLAPEVRDASLWDALFEICRVNEPDPVAAWQAHLGRLAVRSDYLNQRHYAALRFTGPGTALTVGLAEEHLWHGGTITSAAGTAFTANLPTEEVLTLPHKERTEGVVRATKPLSFGGALVENFSLTFAAGRVVRVAAEKGGQGLECLLESDAGAARLGEVAPVPHSSPIARLGRTFYNILIDENAASHLALGSGYKLTVRGGKAMSDEQFAAAGGNTSSIHLDFMIGSAEMQVDGIRGDGGVEAIMRDGEWAVQS